MSDLVADVRQSLEGKTGELWWPGLAQALAQERETQLPFKAAEYSTSLSVQVSWRNEPHMIVSVDLDAPPVMVNLGMAPDAE